jgi:signal transduction histidine kinase
MAEYQNTFYSEVFFISAILALLLAMWTSRQKGEPVKYLVISQLAVAWWALIIGLETAALTPELKFFWSKIAYPGTVFAPPVYFLFTLSYCQVQSWLTRRRILFILSFPTLIVLAAFTNHLHHLLWPSLSIDPITHIAVYQHGPIFYALLIYIYSIMLIGLVLLVRTSLFSPRLYRGQAIVSMLGALIPFMGNITYIFGANPIPGFDWSIVGFLVGGALLTYAIKQVPLFTLVPLARDQVIDYMDDGIVVIDPKGTIADLNKATQRILQIHTPLVGEDLKALEPFGISLQNGLNGDFSVQEVRRSDPQEQYLEIVQTAIETTGSGKAGTLLIIREITARKQAEQRLQKLNRNLEDMVNERTEQLLRTIHSLEKENKTRIQVENELKTLRDNLVNRVVEQSRHLSAIYDIILSSGQSTDVQPMIERTLDRICELFQCDAGCIYEHKEEGGNFELIANIGLTEGQKFGLNKLDKTWITNHVLTYVSLNTQTDTNLPEPLCLAGYITVVTAPLQIRGVITGALVMFWKTERDFPVDQIAFFTAMADQIGIVMENVKLRKGIEQAAVLQERRRLARDLHDSVTQSLHSLVLTSDTAIHRLQSGKTDRLKESLDHIAESARQALKDMRLLLYELRLVKLEDIHLEEAIETRLDSVERRAGLQAEIHSDHTIDWPPHWQGETYTIIIEALNNSLKYARATQVTVTITNNDGKIHVGVEDNGQGFDTRHKRGGIGLKSMAERAEQLGGELTITTSPGSGTRVFLALDPHSNPLGAKK